MRDMSRLYENVDETGTGYYTLKDRFKKSMNEFYENEYYQGEYSTYQKNPYLAEENLYRDNLYREKEYVFQKCINDTTQTGGVLLDVGCGEGHALKFFYGRGWNVTGIDISEYGIKAHHPDMVQYFIKGDIMEEISKMNSKFDFINLDNVLEHVPNPEELLCQIKCVCDENTIVCIRVPNDFSITQKQAYEKGCIDEPFWVTEKSCEHINYFTLETLENMTAQCGYVCKMHLSDWPIDFNLFNPRTNYNRDKSVGHDGHLARLTVENMLFSQSLEKTVKLHETFAELGVGRVISVYMKIK